MRAKRCWIRLSLCVLFLGGLFFQQVRADPVVLSDVPAYNWYHGCGPTAAGSIIGYWDLHGYPNLFDAEGWDEVSLTCNVQDQISSPEHNARYNPLPDDLTYPDSNNCIADFFHTSEGSLPYPNSTPNKADDAFEGYAHYRGYQCESRNVTWYDFSWGEFVNEIDNGNPMMFLVDYDGDGEMDHFVPSLGYDDRGVDGKWYAFYTTWTESETVYWEQFLPVTTGDAWGIYKATYVHMIPEPLTVWLLGMGVYGIRRRSMKKTH